MKKSNILKAFFENPSSGGIVLLICAVFAVVMATVPSGAWFDDIWNKVVGINLGSFSLEMDLRTWVNDALMAVFFFTVGLEIKREVVSGQLCSVRRSVLPTFAALGGMLVPALIYSLQNFGTETASGWGIPMATDIAFAIGIISVLGSRVPSSLKIFLTALAIVDDLGAIVVLAVFYPAHALHLSYLLIVAGVMAVLVMLNKYGRNKLIYIVTGGVVMWYFTLLSGIHATIA
jgi:NhaA family Na+:H+ antiporter